MCTLIIDTREAAVYKRHQNEFAGTKHDVKQITTGDYAVLDPSGKILAIIERKSLEDLGASLKDGRYQNKAKLVDLRATTGCKIIFVIEGKAFPGPHERFANIEYGHIESAIFHMMVREDITVMWTRDTLHTAQTLCSFLRSMNTLCAARVPVDTITNMSTAKIEGAPDGVGGDRADRAAATDDAIKLLTKKIVVSDKDVVREMWACFNGITVTTADEYMEHFSLREIFDGVCPGTIASLKLSTGKSPSKRVVKNLVTWGHETRFLAKVPGISARTAGELLQGRRLAELLHMDVAAIAAIRTGKSQRSLGMVAAGNIKKLFEFKF